MPVIPIRPLSKRNDIRRIAEQSRGAVDASLNEIGQATKRDYEDVVSNWRNKPVFTVVRTRNTVSIKISGPNAKIWVWVNNGTPAHLIRAKRAPNLVFRGGRYSAKTRPNNTRFKGSGTSSGGIVSKKVVHHPGTKARNFDRIIQRRQIENGRKILRRNLAVRRLPV